MTESKKHTLRCIKTFGKSYNYEHHMFIEGDMYILHRQNKNYCVIINRDGEPFAFTRNKERNMISVWIEDYFDYSSPTSTRTVIIEKIIKFNPFKWFD